MSSPWSSIFWGFPWLSGKGGNVSGWGVTLWMLDWLLSCILWYLKMFRVLNRKIAGVSICVNDWNQAHVQDVPNLSRVLIFENHCSRRWNEFGFPVSLHVCVILEFLTNDYSKPQRDYLRLEIWTSTNICIVVRGLAFFGFIDGVTSGSCSKGLKIQNGMMLQWFVQKHLYDLRSNTLHISEIFWDSFLRFMQSVFLD